MKKWFNEMLDAIMTWFRKKVDSTPVPNPIPVPVPGPNPQEPPACACNVAGKILEPLPHVLGGECVYPGADIRFLIYSPAARDVVFFGHFALKRGACKLSQGTINAYCFAAGGVSYHFIGSRAPSSKSELNTARTFKYVPTTRLYYEAR